MPRATPSARVGILYDNISGNIGDVAIGLSLKKILRQQRVEFDELVPGRFNPCDYEKIIVGGGYLLRPSPDFFYDKFKITGHHILNACGILGSPDDLQYLDKYAYVSVRSMGDQRKLDYLSTEVKVVPCTSMLLEDLKNFKREVSSPSVGIHLTPEFLDLRDEEDFVHFASNLGLHVYFLPVTHYQQDSPYLNKLRLKLPDSELIPILSAQEVFTLIGRFDYFISMSLHGAIFAYVHNVPFIVVDREKIKHFMQDRGLEKYLFADLKSMKQAFDELVHDPPDYSKRVANDLSTLRGHVRAIRSILPKATGSLVRGVRREDRRREYANELNAQVQHLQLETIGLAGQIKALEQDLSLRSVMAAQYMKPIERLIALYARRRDLQSAFPEARNGDYLRLVQWARDSVASGRDSNGSVLMDYAKWYADNEWLRLGEQLDLAKKELSQKRSTIESMTAERYQLTEQLDQTRKELEDIHHSLGYKFMRCCASRIDRLFPDRTSRGEFRKVVIANLHIITEQGIKSFSRQVLEKIRHRKFRIVEPLQRGIVHETRLAAPSPEESLVTTSIPPGLRDEDLIRDLREFLSTHESRLEFSAYADPTVSIVIVTYNKAHYTLECLRNLLSHTLPSHEVIIVDNASSDETAALLSKLGNAIVIRNKENRFFAPACNQGAEKARGKYLLFLNADAFVHRGCVSSLTRTLESVPDIGAAGAKLVWRDGRLQEAGSIIWRDASALGYGRDDDPSKPEYSYARDVDYCSAACLIVRRELFERLGGFDETFTPAYYEDTDLCMRIWDAGCRVAYQPMAVATHIEFASSSFESASRLMENQRLTFLAKHAKALERRPGPSENALIRARDRKSRPTILVIDDCVPKPEEGSGYPRMFLMLKSMASLGYRVTLLPLTDAAPKQPETHLLTQMGAEILWGPIGARQLLEDRRDSYDIVLISRPHNALLVMDLVRETNPKARVIYDAEALWYRREQLRRRLGFRIADPRFETEEAELSLIRSADYVTAVSPTEQKLIQEKLGEKERVILLGHPHHVAPTQTPFENRHDLLFVAGFKSAPGPNDDAAIYFTKHLLPRIQEKIPDVRFIIGGSNPPESVKQLASDSVLVLGYVNNLKELYEKARVFVVPTRFAAGIMWKVTEAMSYGLPCVLSTVAAQGLEIRDGEEALIAVDDDDFVKKTAQLYQDRPLWTRTREHELEYVAKNCDPAATEKTLDDLLRRASQPVT